MKFKPGTAAKAKKRIAKKASGTATPKRTAKAAVGKAKNRLKTYKSM